MFYAGVDFKTRGQAVADSTDPHLTLRRNTVDLPTAFKREAFLKKKTWKPMISKGARIYRLTDELQSGQQLVSTLLRGWPTDLPILVNDYRHARSKFGEAMRKEVKRRIEQEAMTATLKRMEAKVEALQNLASPSLKSHAGQVIVDIMPWALSAALWNYVVPSFGQWGFYWFFGGSS
ncbi:uncharacterized protein LY89DRAFT_739396 [Mollisia scopiformis]|uniref:Uncharacterized protein n=1 Tax=Mollisia scopiformis TaxID=149040 RepID=A0A194WTB1_MOLSC|nr:uncharacterized protein LY89DRAFT_739396 [Mollisia scopiformis]KUJ11195.1 hypothetical protein LY89DRAFT_739396 [Mollisia scopiformis]